MPVSLIPYYMQRDPRAFYQPNIVVFSGTRKEHAAEEFVREHVLCHVIAGELRFTEADKDTVAKAGDILLFRRDLLVKCEKRAVDGKPFEILYFVLEREFLQRHAIRHGLERRLSDVVHKPVLFLQPQPGLQGLLNSMRPYLAAGQPLREAMMYHKLTEAILVLQEQSENLEDWLFDFGQPGKIDLKDFMEQNYRFNVPMTKFASLTGRSLSTFQRDFQKIFGTKATTWLLKRRLQAAYETITRDHKMPVEIYLDLGFEDIAHFSRSFKSEFGYNASHLLKSGKALHDAPRVF